MSHTHHPRHSRKKLGYLVGKITFAILIVALIAVVVRRNPPEDRVIVVLSPHYDDAALSLGGFIAKREHQVVVATFFTGGPTGAMLTSWDTASGFASSLETSDVRTKENDAALRVLGVTPINYFYPDAQYRDSSGDLEFEVQVAKDIQALLSSLRGKKVDVYGPAIFSSEITHPDHALLHRAFLNVERDFPQKDVTFYIYEDYPYIERYAKSASVSLEKNLEQESNLLFDRIHYYLTSRELSRKTASLKKYASQVKAFSTIGVSLVSDSLRFTESRCNQPCEVVYKIFRATE